MPFWQTALQCYMVHLVPYGALGASGPLGAYGPLAVPYGPLYGWLALSGMAIQRTFHRSLPCATSDFASPTSEIGRVTNGAFSASLQQATLGDFRTMSAPPPKLVARNSTQTASSQPSRTSFALPTRPSNRVSSRRTSRSSYRCVSRPITRTTTQSGSADSVKSLVRRLLPSVITAQSNQARQATNNDSRNAPPETGTEADAQDGGTHQGHPQDHEPETPVVSPPRHKTPLAIWRSIMRRSSRV